MDRFMLAKRFAGIAPKLLGGDCVRTYHDQALFKRAGGGCAPWLQDSVYWPIDGTCCVTLWMPSSTLCPTWEMSFSSGTNNAGSLGEAVISDDSDAQEPVNPSQQRDLDTWLPGLAPGDLAASKTNPLV